jgi:2-(1,2-epoxy-1,2-dihydrophenyl)acetyl-CoA isomerase
MPSEIMDRVSYDLADGVARIELARPDAGNALDLEMGEALREAAGRVASAAEAGTARVAVLSAQGKMFCVGGDLREFAAAADRGAYVSKTVDVLHEVLGIIHGLSIPVVSVVHGTAAGGGLGVALSADIVLVASQAKLLLAFSAIGLTPDSSTSWVLSRRLSWARIMDLLLTNRTLTGEEAEAWGLASRAVPLSELTAEAESVVATLRRGASTTLGAAKRLVAEAASRPLAEQLAIERDTVVAATVSADGIEGIDAFLAKRPPVFG